MVASRHRLRLLLPAVVLIAVHLFLRGRRRTGGGFVAGLTVAIGMLMQYLRQGLTGVEAPRA